MGGRGASTKGGGGGGGGGEVTKPPQDMTDTELHAAIRDTDKEIEGVKEKMSELSQDLTAARFGAPKAEIDKAMDNYYSAQNTFRGLQQRRSILEDEEIKRRNKNNNGGKTFVNSYGEATQRTISNSTYRNAQRRLERQVEHILGL